MYFAPNVEYKKSCQDFDRNIFNMKKVLYRNQILTNLSFSLVVFLLFSTALTAQEESAGDPAKGKQLFNQNCAACHALDRKMTGPALRNVEQRLADDEGLDREWLHAWIRNNPAVIKSGDAYGVKLYNEYNQAAMTAFPTLSDEDINNILAYTAAKPEEKAAGAGTATGPNPFQEQQSSGISNELVLGALVLVFGILVVMLFLVNKTLQRIATANGVELTKEKEKRIPLWKAFAKNQFLVIVSVIFMLLLGAYFVYGYMMQIGVDQGYAPVQQIHFSHKIHAGDNKIDCKYCHSSARVSKTSGIPSLNICMNCHKTIWEYKGNPEGPSQEDIAAGRTNEFYTSQIKELYDAVGWVDGKYTGETKPVEWVKIHNLPDFVYFNHSQHVSVAGVQCQTCHGPVEEMEIVEQFAPLTMGWCINCHRETNVKMEGNEYYDKIHEELSKKYGVENLTAAQMGGIECGKCHY